MSSRVHATERSKRGGSVALAVLCASWAVVAAVYFGLGEPQLNNTTPSQMMTERMREDAGRRKIFVCFWAGGGG